MVRASSSDAFACLLMMSRWNWTTSNASDTSTLGGARLEGGKVFAAAMLLLLLRPLGLLLRLLL